MKSNWRLISIVALAFIVRLVLVDKFPIGFTADEAGLGYSAFSILKTGHDEWGEFLPLFPRGFGDYKAPLYIYLTIPSIAIFGLSEFAVRLPSVIIGSLCVLIVYFLALELVEKKSVALWSAFLLAISPWHIQSSRIAYEAATGVFFFSTALLLYLKSLRNQKLLPISAMLLGITAYAYHSWRVIAFASAGIYLLLELRSKKHSKYSVLAILLVALMFLPIALNLKVSLKRASDVSIFSQENVNGYFVNKGTSSANKFVARAFDNKYRYLAEQFLANYLSYFSPSFFFSGARPDNSHLNFPGTPLFYPIELFSVGIGLFLLIKDKSKHKNIFIFWLLIAGIPAALTDSFNAQRATTFMPIVTIISAWGVVRILEYRVSRKMIYLLFGACFAVFIYDYFWKLPAKPIYSQRVGYKEAFLKAISLENQFDTIHFSKAYSVPHIFIAFYKQWDPVDFQKASQDWLRYEKAGKKYVDQLESYNLGKYEVHDFDRSREFQRNNALLVSYDDDFPFNEPSIFEVKDQKGNVQFKFVTTSKGN